MALILLLVPYVDDNHFRMVITDYRPGEFAERKIMCGFGFSGRERQNLLFMRQKYCSHTVHALFTCPTTLFVHLKIILLQCFQFSVSATKNSIQTDPIYCPNECHELFIGKHISIGKRHICYKHIFLFQELYLI